MIGLLIFALVVCLVCGVLIYCVRLLGFIPPPFVNIVVVIIILIGLLVIVSRIYPGLMGSA